MKNVFMFWMIQLSCLLSVSYPQPPPYHQPPPDAISLKLLVVGDWGRKGMHGQWEVAQQMGIVGKKHDIHAVISTGDNFYDTGLTSVDDPAFLQSFSHIYTSPSLKKPWLAVLGNHDYLGNASAQFDSALRGIDSRWICERIFGWDGVVADIFLVDTTPFVEAYFRTSSRHFRFDWREVLPRENYINNQLQKLDSMLRKSIARWKIVVGHHPIRSIGFHGDTKELQRYLLPILEARGVDMYLNGHEHLLQHISGTSSNSDIQFFTSGGGSAVTQMGIAGSADYSGFEYFYEGQGFLYLKFNATTAEAAFYNITGKEIYNWNKQKPFSTRA